MLSAEASGRVQKINFESGVAVSAGAVLVELDSQVEKANLAAAQASRDEAALSFERAKKLRASNTIAQSEFDEARAKAQSAEANLASLQATLSRRSIVAPYNGILGIRQIAPGEYINTGTPVVALQSLDPLFVNFSLPQGDISKISVGQQISVSLDAFPGEQFPGKITAINSEIDTNTRTIAVQGTIANPKLQLRPGMFARIEIVINQSAQVIAIPISAISYAPYGDTVYVIETMKDAKGGDYRGVRQQIVKIGEHRGEQAVALSGLKAGEEIATSGTFKLRPNAAVAVNNEIQPGNSTNPRPEDQSRCSA
jgi:membrane fusion protein (multidrug efflux system)